MANRTITLKPIKKSSLDDLYELEEFTYKYRKQHQESKYKKQLEKLETRLKEERHNNKIIYDERRDIWRSLLHKYLSVKVMSNDGKTVGDEYYIFPYSLIGGNNCLAFLKVHCTSNYESGVNDMVWNIFKEFNVSTLKIKEITEKRFLKMAEKRCKDVLAYRKHRIATEEERGENIKQMFNLSE